MKILLIPDIHGEHEKFQNALDEFEGGDYDVCIQLGDLADSFTRTNKDILRCFYISRNAKDKYGDRYIQLWGNHCWQYLFGRMMCSGFRPDLSISLNPWLNENKSWFQIAYQVGDYVFTHAGIIRKWVEKHTRIINSIPGDNIADKLNGMWNTQEGCDALYEVGVRRGGLRGDYGGPMWCDRVEMESYGPIKHFHQYVGHTSQKYVDKVIRFEGGKHYNNTSVTFCDVIQTLEKFWTIVEI